MPDDRYPTQAEFEAAGGQAGGSINTPVSLFRTADFAAAVSGSFSWINEIDVKLRVSVIDQDDGAVLNASEAAKGGTFYRPKVSVPVALEAAALTQNRTCGITGKAFATGKAALNLLTGVPGDVFKVWSYNQTKYASDKALSACSPPASCGGDGGGDPDDPPPMDERRVSTRLPGLTLSVTDCDGGGGGGGDTGGGGYEVKICSYMDYYDPNDGHYLYTVNLGCRYEYYEE